MKIDKKKIFKKFIAIFISAIFLFNLYIANLTYISLFKWAPRYEFIPSWMPKYGAQIDGAQYLLAIYVVFPVFIISGILTASCGKWCGFSYMTRGLPLIGLILPFIIMGVNDNTFGLIILLSVNLLALYLFICDIFEVNGKFWKDLCKKYYYIILVLVILIGIGTYFFKDNIKYYFKYNIAWNTWFSNLTEQEKEQLVISVFEDKNFNSQKAQHGLKILLEPCYAPPSAHSQEIQLIKRLVQISNNNTLKLSVLKANINKECYGDAADFSNTTTNWKDAESILKTYYQQGNIDYLTAYFTLDQYTKTTQVSRDEKLTFFWDLIINYQHQTNFFWLLKHFFELQPIEYKENIMQYIVSNKNPEMRAAMLYFVLRSSWSIENLQHIPDYQTVMKKYDYFYRQEDQKSRR